MKEVNVTKITEVQKPEEWINVKVKVVELEEPQSRPISQTGLLGDETGQIRFVSWKKSNLPSLEEGESYLIKNVVVNSWQGKLQLSLNRTSEIKQLGEEIQVRGPEIEKEVKEKAPELEGTVRRMIPKSGYIERCPECGRVLVDGHCVVHIDVEPVEDLRVKVALDNSSKIAILKEKTAEKLLGVSIEEAKNTPEEDLTDLIQRKVLGKKFKFKGTDFGKNFLVTEFERIGD